MDIELVNAIAQKICDEHGWGIAEYIDAGASGAVYKISHPIHGDTALKVYDPAFFEGDNALIEERRIELQSGLTKIGHPNLINTLSAEKFELGHTWYLLMEFCPWPSMQKCLSSIPDESVPHLIRQLAEAVIFLSANDIVHRDVKPANIAVSDDFSTLKLLDLGVMRNISFSEGNGTDINEKRRFVATAQYSPPEYISRQEEKGIDGFNALNLYQVGAVLYDLIMKRPIFSEEAETLNRYILYSSIVKRVPAVYNSEIPPRLIAICRAALQKDPIIRASSVSMEDFSKEHDAIDDIRRRLAPQRNSHIALERVSLLSWRNKTRSWISAAAKLESVVLGSHRLTEVKSSDRIKFSLEFDEIGASVCVVIRSCLDGEALEVTLETHSGGEATGVLKITAEGPDLPEDVIVSQLREQILYHLDSTPRHSEGESASE